MIFNQKKNKYTDSVYCKKTSELSFCSLFRNRYLNGFNISICFIRRLHFQKTQSSYFSTIKELFNKPIFLFHQGGFVQVEIFALSGKLSQAKSFPSSRKFSTTKIFPLSRKFSSSKDIAFAKQAFNKPRFFLFLYPGSFLPQAKIFPSSRKFSSSIDILFIKDGFHKPRFFLHQGSFSQGKIFTLSNTFSTSKDFSTSQGFRFPQAKVFL